MGTEGAAELFATTLDVYLLLGWIAEDSSDHNTADGRPATKAAAHARLARMLCADLETSTLVQRDKLVNRLLLKQVYTLKWVLEQVVANRNELPRTVVVAGEGEFLVLPVLKQQEAFPACPIVRLQTALGADIARAACAYAVAVLAAEERL